MIHLFYGGLIVNSRVIINKVIIVNIIDMKVEDKSYLRLKVLNLIDTCKKLEVAIDNVNEDKPHILMTKDSIANVMTAQQIVENTLAKMIVLK